MFYISIPDETLYHSAVFSYVWKNMGWIGHFPEIYASYHDPITFTDYFNQVKRWNVGFFQTVKKYGVWPSLFWLSTGFFSIENVLLSISIFLLPIVVSLW